MRKFSISVHWKKFKIKEPESLLFQKKKKKKKPTIFIKKNIFFVVYGYLIFFQKNIWGENYGYIYWNWVFDFLENHSLNHMDHLFNHGSVPVSNVSNTALDLCLINTIWDTWHKASRPSAKKGLQCKMVHFWSH
jgi:hypothetical protein